MMLILNVLYNLYNVINYISTFSFKFTRFSGCSYNRGGNCVFRFFRKEFSNVTLTLDRSDSGQKKTRTL